MPLFDNAGRLAQDRCAIDQRDLANRNASSYVLTNHRPRPDRSSELLSELKQQHRNLHAWDGYGWNVARVDDDSRMRLSSVVTRGKARMQLNSRVFAAAPDLRLAAADPCLDGCDDSEDEMGLEDGGVPTRGCGSKAQISETDFDRFDPGYCPPGLDNIVPCWALGGAMSRDISRSKKFQRLITGQGNAKAARRAERRAREGAPAPEDAAHDRWRCVASGLPKQLCTTFSTFSLGDAGGASPPAGPEQKLDQNPVGVLARI